MSTYLCSIRAIFIGHRALFPTTPTKTDHNCLAKENAQKKTQKKPTPTKEKSTNEGGSMTKLSKNSSTMSIKEK